MVTVHPHYMLMMQIWSFLVNQWWKKNQKISYLTELFLKKLNLDVNATM